MIIMFVYYDAHGNIRAITPAIDSTQDTTLKYGPIPFSDVEHILTGQKNPLEYIVSELETATGTIHALIKKNQHVNFKRTLNSSLSEIKNEDASVTIENYISTKTLTVKLHNANLLAAINLHFTKKSDPHTLVKTIQISHEDLQNQIVSIKYTENLEDTSVFIYNQNNQYGYKIIKGSNGV